MKMFLIGGTRHGEEITDKNQVGNEYLQTQTKDGQIFFRHYTYLIFEPVKLSDLLQYISKNTVGAWIPLLQSLEKNGYVQMWSNYYGRFIEVEGVDFSKGRAIYKP